MAASASTEELKQGRPGIDFGKGVDQIPTPDGGSVPGNEVYRAWQNRKGGFPMIAQVMDTVTGTPVYVNPMYVVTLRPDPADPDHISIITLRNGESIRVRGEHREVADRVVRTS